MRRPTVKDRVAVLLAAAVLAGCSEAGRGPGVAHLATTTTVASNAHPSAPSEPAYAACMRAHGVPLFPDPDKTGAISPGPGVDPSSPTFQAAQQSCKPLLPAGGNASSTQGGAQLPAQQLAQLLAFAKCMRAHGVADFPDPTSRGIALEPGQVPNSPTFQAAQQVCEALLPQGGTTRTARPGGAS